MHVYALENKMTIQEKTNEIMKKLGNLLIIEQKTLGLNNLQMALKCDISLREYNKLISRKATSCRLTTLVSVLENTNISSKDILDY